VRTSALVLIALVFVLAAVRFAEAFLVPLVISVFLSYALSPLVARLEAWRVSRAFAAAFGVRSHRAAAWLGRLARPMRAAHELPNTRRRRRERITRSPPITLELSRQHPVLTSEIALARWLQCGGRRAMRAHSSHQTRSSE
jgi:hypothetical protein